MKAKKGRPKRRVIPIDFSEEVIVKLKALSEMEGFKLATFARHLIVTHPKMKK